MIGNNDWAAKARIVIWLLSPSSDNNTRENIPKSVPGLSQVSGISEFDLARVKIPKDRNMIPDMYVIISIERVAERMKPKMTAIAEEVASATIVARSTNLGR
jgi:hypothetical protein